MTEDFGLGGFSIENIKATIPTKITTEESIIKFESLFGEKSYPVLATRKVQDVDLVAWLSSNRQMVYDKLKASGALLFRGFDIKGADEFFGLLDSFEEEILIYKQRSSPRHEVRDKVYTSTDHPEDQMINMHNENSYAFEWPMKIAFYCDKPSLTGGETPIADSRAILNALSKETIEKFERLGVKYIRNLGTGLGMGWEEVFQTSDKKVVEEYCEKNDISFEWKDDGQLKLEYTRPAIVKHPHTGELVWFNHAYFFNIHSLDHNLKQQLLSYTDVNSLPFMTFYGDGSEIQKSTIDEIRAAYERESVLFKWKKNDVLLLDNMLVAHGRKPFEGERKILVGMLQPVKY